SIIIQGRSSCSGISAASRGDFGNASRRGKGGGSRVGGGGTVKGG
ncbi:unnamed protein product, partial [Rotaria magnacalcarata]